MIAPTSICTLLLTIVCGLPGALGTPPVPPQPTNHVGADDRADLVAWADAIVPDLERLTGRAFIQRPPVRVISEDDLAETLAKPMREAMIRMGASTRPDGSPMSDLEITVRTRSQAYRIANHTLGLYDHAQKVVLVVPANAAKLGARRGWSEETVRRIVKLALAHELVHALQDQTANLAKRLDALSGEAEKCLLAVSEGHAVIVTDALARERSWQTAAMVLNGLTTGVENRPAPGSGSIPDVHGAPTAEVYTAGAEFVRHHSGDDLRSVWVLLEHPPVRWSAIRDPGSFTPERKDATPPAAVPPKP